MSEQGELSRRDVVLALIAGSASAAGQEEKKAEAAKPTAKAIDAAAIQDASWVADLELTPAECESAAGEVVRLNALRKAYRKTPLPNGLAPALVFDPTWGEPAESPAPAKSPSAPSRPATLAPENTPRPATDADLAFSSITQLASLLKRKKISSVELTKLYLERLSRFDPQLFCTVSKTTELAMKQAAAADQEIQGGKHRGPLHGVPWGAKDLIAYPGYPTTWGAELFKDQRFAEKATVAEKLDAAGAVLIAKLSLGTLAEGDRWFGGKTRNPWRPTQGSSGSSAGSASATAAGLAAFTIGSETLGSIVSPCRRCGASGLRPTFGRVSRFGCMSVSWSMDKIGPIARSVEDCALVFQAILGVDPRDRSTVDRPFVWPHPQPLKEIRVGYFEGLTGTSEKTLAVLKDMGVTLVPIQLPRKTPAEPLIILLNVEAAAAFDDVSVQRKFAGLNNWPNTFLKGQFVTAVEYLRANRLRTRLMEEMREVMKSVDVYVGGNDLVITNLTGHPTVVCPNGFVNNGVNDTPTSITFTGRLFGEGALLAVADAYQKATGWHKRRPPLFS